METKQLSRYQKLQKRYSAKTSSFFKEADAKRVLEAISTGENYYLRRNTVETSAFDSTWISRIEDCLGDIGEILKDPKKVTKTIENLVPVELAKKTNAVSVRHLASHTQFIKEIKDDGSVIPNKILSIESDDDYATYENRFVATLVRRLILFVEKRYDFIMKYAPLKTVEEMKIKSKTIIDGSMVEIETVVKVTKPSDYKGIDEDNKYIERISEVRRYLRYYYGSSFMKMMKTEKDVRSPIIMTNILRKNPKYNKCYKLFKFIETYDGLGISYSLSGGYLKLEDENLKEINAALMANFLALNAGEPSRLASEINKTHKPKVLKSEEDELFEFNSNFKGPIEFIRVDEQYRNLTETLTKMPKSMRKEEEEYNADTRLENREKRIFKDLTNRLLARRRKEVAEFDKKAKAIIAKREKEEAERIKLLEELARQERERLENEARKALIEQAKADLKALNEEKREERRKKKAEELARKQEALAAKQEAEQKSEPTITEEPTPEVVPAPVEEEPVPEPTPEPDPVVEETPIEEAPIEEAPVEEAKEEIPEPTPEPIEEEKPQEVVEEPVPEPVVVEEQPVEEVPAPEQEVEPTPVVGETPVEEPAQEVKEEPKKKVVRKKAPAKKKAAPKKKKEKPVEEVKEEVAPVEASEPIEEVPVAEPVQETPVEETPVAEETPIEVAPIIEEAPKEEPVSEPTPEPVPEEVPAPVEKPKKAAPKKKAPAKKKPAAKKPAAKKEAGEEKKATPKKAAPKKAEESKPAPKKPAAKKPSEKKKKKEPYVSKPVQTYKPVEKPKGKLNPNFKPKFKRNKIKRRK